MPRLITVATLMMSVTPIQSGIQTLNVTFPATQAWLYKILI